MDNLINDDNSNLLVSLDSQKYSDLSYKISVKNKQSPA